MTKEEAIRLEEEREYWAYRNFICERCGGSGWVYKEEFEVDYYDIRTGDQKPCPDCYGNGRRDT